MEDENRRSGEIRVSRYPGSARYYLVTGTSGYPSADFRYPGLFRDGRSNLVVPEVRIDSAGLPFPGTYPQP